MPLIDDGLPEVVTDEAASRKTAFVRELLRLEHHPHVLAFAGVRRAAPPGPG